MELPTPIPVQIYLYPSQLAELQALADRWHVAVEDVARQGVATFLLSQRLASEPLPEGDSEDFPLQAFVGLVGSGLSDLAANHDEYLIEFEMESNRSWPEESS